ncbi:hypothetical protein OPV22_016404 [Ensete ventricosum]|uniref:Uncharacterized protein n=1 Tax=Ensete ventricosum TaxID=4639 RepID=A0AAV8QVE5_ENSVE|nr:hypothetical protein OPV22_016404 [Ensete ventricosum]
MSETMEGQASSVPMGGEVETTRPFRSVKDAVALLDERFLSGHARSPKAYTRPISSHPAPKAVFSASSSSPSYTSSAALSVFRSLRNVEAEVEEMKRELMLLKERESDTARAIATLSFQFRKSMCKAAEIEAAVNAAESTVSMELPNKARSEPWRDDGPRSVEKENDFGGRRKIKLQKRKPVIPLTGDLLSGKTDSIDLDISLYPRSTIYSFS